MTPRLINRYFWLIDHYMNREGRPSRESTRSSLRSSCWTRPCYKQYVA
ncbi:MAG: hypothetical protein MZU97_12490 [Bacillus subtilis]|nr:hypothetical protein [Bacillus subtilis]